jgi:hypothetical protein
MPDVISEYELRFSEAHRFPDKDIVVPEITVHKLDHAVVLGLSLPYCLKRYSEQAAPIPECCRGSPFRW